MENNKTNGLFFVLWIEGFDIMLFNLFYMVTQVK
jgi:hypothetical protein